MREVEGNLWETPCDLRFITTNGYVTKRGRAVMGRGCALEAKERYPGVDRRLGTLLTTHGNRTMLLGFYGDAWLGVFPVKHRYDEQADLALIERSAHQMVEIVNKYDYKQVLLPRPGCGNGRLQWDEVKEALEVVRFDERFSVIDFKR